MIKNILIFVSVISVSLSIFRPMTSRTIDFGDNVCHYKEYKYTLLLVLLFLQLNM